MNTNMTGFPWFLKNFCVFVLWRNIASALEGLINIGEKTYLVFQYDAGEDVEAGLHAQQLQGKM